MIKRYHVRPFDCKINHVATRGAHPIILANRLMNAMHKSFTSFLLAILLFLGGNLLGQNKYKLITSASDLATGEKYIIASASSGTASVLGLQNTNNRAQATDPSTSFTITSSIISLTPASAITDTKAYEISIEAGSDATHYYLRDLLQTNTYLVPASGSNSNNYLKGQLTASDWTITFSSNAAVITNTGNPNTNGRNIIRYNSANVPPLFSCYASGSQNAVYFYRKAYNVIYNDNGSSSGSVPTDASSPYFSGATVTVKANTGTLVKSGFVFSGWNTAADGSGTAYAATGSATFSMPSANVILYAQWTPTYTVTYNGNGNTSGTAPVDGSSPYTSGSTVTVLGQGTLVNSGFNFTGWNTAANGSGTPYAAGSTFTIGANTTLYAQWTAASGHTVIFYANGGSGSMASQNSNVAANLTSNTFTRTGYSFTKWNTAVNGSGTDYANGANYDFSADMTLYAQWTINSYTLSYDGNGYDGGTVNSGGSYNYNSSITLPSPTMTKANYTFAGWNTQADGNGTNYLAGATYNMPAANTTLYAKWTINSYTITFNGNGQTSGTPSVASVSGNYNTNVTLATIGTLVKTGYTFVGWNTANDGSGTDYAAGSTYSAITSSFTLYAKWTINSYTVTFDGNGSSSGSANPTSVSGNYNSTVTLAAQGTLVKTGYTFAGWNTLINGSGTNYAAGASYTVGASNVTLYAKWTPNNNTITFDGNGATGGSTANQTIATGATANLNTNGYTRTGYTFAGWATTSGGTVAYTDGASYNMGTSSVTLYAVWTALPVSKTYKLISSTSDLEVGKKYLIVNSGAAGSGVAVGLQNTNNRALSSAITITGTGPIQTITTPASSSSGTQPFEFTLGGSTGAWTLYDGVNGGYLYAVAGNNYLKNQASPIDNWAITFSGNAAVMQDVSVTSETRTIRYNSGSSIFSCYTTGQAAVYLYKEDCNPPTTPTGSFTTGTAVCGSTDITYTGTIPGGEAYYWQTTTTGISTTYPVTSGVAFSAPSSGVWYIRSKVSTCWSAELASPSITVTQAVSISTQPANTSVVAGSSGSFSVAATNGSGYQWQLNTGSGWNDIIGETGASYNIPSATSGMNGYQYRCVVKGTSPCSDVNSNAATLTVTNPVVNTISNQSNVYGSIVSLTATATATVSSWSATLPAGLSINSSGVITGTLTEDVINSPFACSVTANFTAGGSNTKNFTWTITPKTLTISGLTGNNKVYDGNTTATLSGTASLVGIVGSDNVTLSGTPASTFNNKNVGTGKPITVTGYTLTGTKAGNYTLTQPTGITGNITAKALTVTGATAQDKTYDGTTAAAITGATPVGVISPDVVTIGGGGTFASANAGTGISVTAGLTLGGADAGNYTLTQPTGLSANINKANPVFTTSTINVSVGGTYLLPGANISSTSGGAFSYSITGGGNATLSGTTITGAVVGTETLTVTQAATANYNAGSTTVTVNVSTITYQHGDFRTKTAGKWSYNGTPPVDITQWEKYNSTIPGWEDFTGQPNTNPSYTAYITKNTEIPTDATAHGRAKIIVMRDPVTNVAPTLTFKPSVNWTFKNVIIKEGATIEMQTKGFNVDALGDFEIEDGGNFIFNYSSNGNPASGLSLWAGNEIFHPESNFYIYNHTANASEYFLPAAADMTSNTYNSVDGYFGNLIIQSTDANGFKLTTSNLSSTTKYLTHKDLIINTVSAYTLLYGSGTWIIGRDLKIGSTASNALTLTTGANTITFNVKRNLIKGNGNIFRFLNNASGNVSINVDGDVQVNSGTIDVNLNATGVGLLNTKGSLTVESGASLTASSSTTTTPSAVVKFSGANIQNVSGAGTINIYHMVTDKTGGYVNLQRDLQTKRTLTMTAGNIQTNANLFELGESTSNTGTLSYTSGFVLGNMKRWFSGTSAGTDTKDLFPLGFYETGFGSDGLKNRFAKVRFTGGSPSGALTAFFVGSPMGNNSIPILVGSANSAPDVTFDITSTEDQGYWDISVSSGTFTSAETYTMTLLGEGFKTINNTTDLVLLKRPNIPTAWFVPGTSGFGAINSSYGSSIPSIVRNGVSLFSHYGFGGGDPNPLPVELTSFSGVCVEDGISQISWSTASEFNSKEFIVQRSEDGIHYKNIAVVPSSGNSDSPKHYSIKDTASSANSSYYRLVQVDYDGKQTIYSFIQVRCGEVSYMNIFYAQPGITVEISADKNKEIGLNVYEISGRLIHHENKQILRGFNRFDLNLQKKLANGIYIIQMVDGDDVSSTKLMIH